MHTPYEKLLVSLVRAEVNFIVVGGVAVALNGFVRTTEDVDILIERSEDNVRRLLGALQSFGEGHARELGFDDFEEAEGAVRLIEDFPLDMFTVMRGQTYQDLINRSHHSTIGDANINFLGAEALIELKEPSDREKDQIDVAALRRQMENRS
jgi:hypothetical protein